MYVHIGVGSLLINVSKNQFERDKFVQTITPLCPSFDSKSTTEKFRAIMNLHFDLKSNDKQKVISITVSFVMKTYKAFLTGLWNS